MNSRILLYDGTWEGMLCCIFDYFDYKLQVESITSNQDFANLSLFASPHQVTSDSEKANRVAKGLEAKVGKEGLTELWHVFLSELPHAPLLILKTAVYYLNQDKNSRLNYGHEDVLEVKQIVKSVSRERHRMKAFIRFQKLNNGIYFALVEPDFDVLPLIRKHFKDRYADQHWMIYDGKRKYGLSYDLESIQEFSFTEDVNISNKTIAIQWEEQEDLYSDLWKRYFNAVNIKERKNMKLHLQHVPRRYWKHLNEKELDK
ncbi:TIGR03915 family putative DNA repair protein [Sphingobacterium hungaricum]|uniref:DUF4130 domain-containing protein n=1 Tax=Sphingobacterium hungaricum TaxID=2082723 RepID=A0A928YRL9_9SPHI|nr:TIGR03915 family putative DNA repair protein [Sphingobacterium hungaricum]MBE8715124.1 hypothetical protein [Sphingobacterium hungaricum]